jgi:hypothetical protein
VLEYGRAGQEVTISYGHWSNEVFFLFFGFVLGDNPWDSVTVFRDLPEMIAYHDDLEVRLCAALHVSVTWLAADQFVASATTAMQMRVVSAVVHIRGTCCVYLVPAEPVYVVWAWQMPCAHNQEMTMGLLPHAPNFLFHAECMQRKANAAGLGATGLGCCSRRDG